MIPLKQTKLHEPPKQYGNCVATCFASIMEISIDEVPKLEDMMDWGQPRGQDIDWIDVGTKFCESKGYEWKRRIKDHLQDGSYYMVIGKSPRGDFSHCVIYQNGKLAHDPHPDNTGILSEEYMEVIQKQSKGEFSPGVEWLSESIDMETMFRVKGKQGLWCPKTRPNKAGMLYMNRFMSNEGRIINRTNLQGFGNAVIFTHDGDLSLLEAFDNLQKHSDNDVIDPDEFLNDPKTIEKNMNIIAPNHTQQFKEYHARKVVIWYNEIVYAVNEAAKTDK